MPAESAVAFGLHPNAEIGFKLREAASFCDNLKRLQVRIMASSLVCSLLCSRTRKLPTDCELPGLSPGTLVATTVHLPRIWHAQCLKV